METPIWPPPPSGPAFPQEQPLEAAPSKVWKVARLIAGVLGGFLAPAAAFWSGLLFFLVAAIEQAIRCDKLEVCGQWYQPLYLLIGCLVAVVLGAISGGLAVSCLQRAVNPGK